MSVPKMITAAVVGAAGLSTVFFLWKRWSQNQVEGPQGGLAIAGGPGGNPPPPAQGRAGRARVNLRQAADNAVAALADAVEKVAALTEAVAETLGINNAEEEIFEDALDN